MDTLRMNTVLDAGNSALECAILEVINKALNTEYFYFRPVKMKSLDDTAIYDLNSFIAVREEFKMACAEGDTYVIVPLNYCDGKIIPEKAVQFDSPELTGLLHRYLMSGQYCNRVN